MTTIPSVPANDKDDPSLIEVVGKDRLLHRAHAHEDKAICGMDIFAKVKNPTLQYFSCYECTY